MRILLPRTDICRFVNIFAMCMLSSLNVGIKVFVVASTYDFLRAYLNFYISVLCLHTTQDTKIAGFLFRVQLFILEKLLRCL